MSTHQKSSWKLNKGAIISLVAVAVLSMFLFINAGSILAPGRMPGQVGPDLWPRFILGLLIFLSLIKIIQLSLLPPPQVKIFEDSNVEEPVTEERDWHVLIVAGLMVFGYVFAIHFLGFFIATLIFLWSFTYLGKWRKKGLLAIIALIGTLAVNFLFHKIIYIPLPKGQYIFEDITVMIYKTLGIF